MGATELRNKLIEDISSADERLLKVVNAVIESYNDVETVAYSITGEPLSAQNYKHELSEAEQELKNKKIISQEELEKQSESW